MVSIVIPAYNTEKYIRECLDSALGQTYSDIELVIVDDGSTDSTPSIIRTYAARDSRVKIFFQQNRGPSAARNLALRMAEGEWIMCLDSDDALAPDAVERLLSAAMSVDADYVEASWVEGSECRPWAPVDAAPGKVQVYGVEAYIENVLYQKKGCPSVWAKLFSRKLAEAMTFREGKVYEDLDLFYLLAEKAKRIALIPERVYFYRQNPSSITHVFSPRRFDVLDATRRIEEYMAEHHPQLLPAARDRRLSANFNMFGLIAAHTSATDSSDGAIASTELYSATADSCWQLIKSYRLASLLNPRVRLKNKLGILASYLGRPVVRMLSKKVYGRKLR